MARDTPDRSASAAIDQDRASRSAFSRAPSRRVNTASASSSNIVDICLV
jgi:hypothetical protein